MSLAARHYPVTTPEFLEDELRSHEIRLVKITAPVQDVASANERDRDWAGVFCCLDEDRETEAAWATTTATLWEGGGTDACVIRSHKEREYIAFSQEMGPTSEELPYLVLSWATPEVEEPRDVAEYCQANDLSSLLPVLRSLIRTSFQGIKSVEISLEKDPEIPDIIKQITTYPEHQRTNKIESFHCQMRVMMGFIAEAQKRDNTYYLIHSISELVLFGGRLILAHNRILFPYHKWFLHELENAPEKPDNMLELTEKLLKEPSLDNAVKFAECIFTFNDWPLPPEGEYVRFTEDSEWNWLDLKTPIQDR